MCRRLSRGRLRSSPTWLSILGRHVLARGSFTSQDDLAVEGRRRRRVSPEDGSAVPLVLPPEVVAIVIVVVIVIVIVRVRVRVRD